MRRALVSATAALLAGVCAVDAGGGIVARARAVPAIKTPARTVCVNIAVSN
jgi:hypothetical protein